MGESELKLANLRAETVAPPKSFRDAKLHSAYSPTGITETEIQNPYLFGTSINDKQYILDAK